MSYATYEAADHTAGEDTAARTQQTPILLRDATQSAGKGKAECVKGDVAKGGEGGCEGES